MDNIELVLFWLCTMNGQVRVLIADDRQSARQGLKALLSFTSHVEIIGEASNGQEAVQIAAQTRPDVVLMDMHMPVMDGLQATQQIKTAWPETWIVVLTIYPTYQKEALKAGADVFLIKGCAAETLEAAIFAARDSERLNV
jgi:YesN/AraC family two-component response regulator